MLDGSFELEIKKNLFNFLVLLSPWPTATGPIALHVSYHTFIIKLEFLHVLTSPFQVDPHH